MLVTFCDYYWWQFRNYDDIVTNINVADFETNYQRVLKLI